MGHGHLGELNNQNSGKDYDCHDDEHPENHVDVHLLIFNPQKVSGASPKTPQLKWSLLKNGDSYKVEQNDVTLTTPATFDGGRTYMCSFTNHGNMYMAGGTSDKLGIFILNLIQTPSGH